MYFAGYVWEFADISEETCYAFRAPKHGLWGGGCSWFWFKAVRDRSRVLFFNDQADLNPVAYFLKRRTSGLKSNPGLGNDHRLSEVLV